MDYFLFNFSGVQFHYTMSLEKLALELEQIEDISMSDFGFVEGSDLDINDEDFLSDNQIKEKEPKKVTCPHCGQEFEL